MGDLNRRRGIVQGMDDSSAGKIINAQVPLVKCLVMRLICALQLKAVPATLWNLNAIQKRLRILLKRLLIKPNF